MQVFYRGSGQDLDNVETHNFKPSESAGVEKDWGQEWDTIA